MKEELGILSVKDEEIKQLKSRYRFFFFHVIYTVNYLKNVLVVRAELVTGVQVQFWSPILTHSKSSSQCSWPWMTAVAGAVGQGEKKKTLPPMPSS